MEETTVEEVAPSSLEDFESLRISETSGETEIATETTSTITTTSDDAHSSGTATRAEATEAVTDSDRVTAGGNLKIRSKRTERLQRKMLKKSKKTPSAQPTHLLLLPNEILVNIMTSLLPSDIFRFVRTCRNSHQFVQHNGGFLSREIIAHRYSIIEKCFRLPVPLSDIDPKLHPCLQNPRRVEALKIHRSFQHIPSPDHHSICTCITCVLRWNSLCVAVDFSYWQTHLQNGEPIPTIARGDDPEWNKEKLAKTKHLVGRAVTSPLLYACMLEGHLKNTTAAIKRQRENKGNQRRHFPMTQVDVDAETDEFLSREGPVSTEVPFHRDNYYMLEAYMLGRSWIKEAKEWVYTPENFHEKDLDLAAKHWSPSLPTPSEGVGKPQTQGQARNTDQRDGTPDISSPRPDMEYSTRLEGNMLEELDIGLVR